MGYSVFVLLKVRVWEKIQAYLLNYEWLHIERPSRDFISLEIKHLKEQWNQRPWEYPLGFKMEDISIKTPAGKISLHSKG